MRQYPDYPDDMLLDDMHGEHTPKLANKRSKKVKQDKDDDVGRQGQVQGQGARDYDDWLTAIIATAQQEDAEQARKSADAGL